MREIIVQSSKVEFETGDVLKFKTEQGSYTPGRVIVLEYVGTGFPADFRVIGSDVTNSWASNEWLEALMKEGAIAFMGNIGPVN